MGRSRPRSPFKAAIAALQLDLARHEADAARTRELITALMARVEGGTRDAVQGPVHDVPPAKRKRRRHKSRPITVRKAKRGIAAKRVTVGHAAISVPAPEPVFASQLSEIEQIHLAAGRDATKIPPASLIRIDLLLREMAAEGVRYRLPTWLTKSIRMRIRRASKRPEKPPMPKPKKAKAPRKPAIPISPPRVERTDWHPDENGNLVREVITT